MLRVENLYKKFSGAETASINGLSFQFPNDKIIGLLGPNGAGKTTTLSIVSGLITEYRGDIFLMGENIREAKTGLVQQIGIVPQQIAMYATLSCEENLLYFGSLYNIPKEELRKRIETYLQEFGLFEHRKKQIRHFSGGMKRRANIIASLLHQPKLLILDEPTAGVDVQSRNMILEFLKKYHQLGNSIIYTSHILEEAETLCHEVLIIDAGKKIVQGEPSKLIAEYDAQNLEHLFLKLTGIALRD